MKFYCFLLIIAQISCSIYRIPLKKTYKPTYTSSPTTQNHSFIEKLQTTVSNLNNIRLNNYFDSQYSGSIQLGSDNTTYNIIFDTGSQWLFLPDKNCRSCVATNYFTCSDSKTCYNTTNNLISISYGKGFISGFPVYDQILINGKLFITKHKFINVIFQKDFDGFSADGLCGLGLDGFIDRDTENNLIRNLFLGGQIDNQMFSFKLLRESHSNDDVTSEMVIGGYDNDSFIGNMSFYDVSSNQNYWAIDLEKVFFNGGLIKNSVSQALIDTGTSILIIPTSEFVIFYEMLKKNNNNCIIVNHVVKCACPDGDISKFPDFIFVFNGVNYTLEPEYYVSQSQHICYLYVGSLVSSGDLWILGDKFMHKYYTVFDGGNLKIGLAEIKKEYIEKYNFWSFIVIVSVIIVGISAAVLGIFLINKVCKLQRPHGSENLLGN